MAIYNQVGSACARMSTALGRVDLTQLPIESIGQASVETFKAILIEVSVEFNLPTKLEEDLTKGAIGFLGIVPQEKGINREHVLAAFLLEVTIKRVVLHWQTIWTRAKEYGVPGVEDPDFKMSASMKKSTIKEVSELLTIHAAQIKRAEAQSIIYHKVKAHEQA